MLQANVDSTKLLRRIVDGDAVECSGERRTEVLAIVESFREQLENFTARLVSVNLEDLQGVAGWEEMTESEVTSVLQQVL